MVIEAAYADGTGAANALHMSQAQWEELQRAYCVGDLLMPCCNAPAIPKALMATQIPPPMATSNSPT